MSSYLIDTYAWVEYLIGSKEGEKARQFIEQGGSCTPSIAIVELAQWYLREIGAGRRTQEEMQEQMAYVSSVSVVVPLDEALAKKAGEIDFAMKKRLKRWPIADSVMYATAREFHSEVVRGDPHFRKLDDVKFIAD